MIQQLSSYLLLFLNSALSHPFFPWLTQSPRRLHNNATQKSWQLSLSTFPLTDWYHSVLPEHPVSPLQARIHCLMEALLTRTQGFYLLLYSMVFIMYVLTECFSDEWMYVWCLFRSLIKMTLSVSVLPSSWVWISWWEKRLQVAWALLYLSPRWKWMKQRCSPWLCPTMHLLALSRNLHECRWRCWEWLYEAGLCPGQVLETLVFQLWAYFLLLLLNPSPWGATAASACKNLSQGQWVRN